ncbi:myocyte-specific enhancer factor 2C-like [Phycodurus eques]|uniref:myocyte-specific enhancer factor 2C-like n=1 Tax=Phycodurus eques TaxID=693459 RepID=UPI002ACD4C18|nr:myocyte-specific enhancer factor 2C-like [Phycodurus eques]XP_061553896.1 myocyte-specific enhancer factor 2C-like [Phycodurus eques]XP_061553897.1 myocyte-specific enhancer factor 2C-like [Phycodurus eques]
MGRKKIQIARIVDERNRHVTFTKRKFGLMKKAYELSVLCDCEIALIVFNGTDKLFQYASTDMDKVLLKYTEYNEPHESRTNADIVHTLRKKGLSGGESPDVEADDSAGQSPDADDKFAKLLDDDIDLMLTRHRICGLPVSNYDMGMNASPLLYSHPGIGGAAGDHNLPPIHHAAVQRSAASPRRPPGGGDAGLSGSELTNAVVGVGNGVYGNRCPSPVAMSPEGVRDKSPPTGASREPDLRLPMPPANQCGDVPTANARINHAQTAQTLSSPAASASAGTSGFPSSLSSYGAEFSPGGELSCLTAFGSAGPDCGWRRRRQQQDRHVRDLRDLPLGHMGNLCQNANVHFPSGHQNLHIKSEPASPPRERGGAAGLTGARPGRSPADGASGCGSSYDDGGGDFLPSVKRVRLTEGWAT